MDYLKSAPSLGNMIEKHLYKKGFFYNHGIGDLRKCYVSFPKFKKLLEEGNIRVNWQKIGLYLAYLQSGDTVPIKC